MSTGIWGDGSMTFSRHSVMFSGTSERSSVQKATDFSTNHSGKYTVGIKPVWSTAREQLQPLAAASACR